MSMKELLRIENLRLYFDTEEGTVKALEDVTVSVK
ncbi:MAG: ABC transporter ATP-binding protein, partial [Pseudothermotoga sp.]|nr:ABC transporter ATP-binding protein [Pseudothermotoga sp.]